MDSRPKHPSLLTRRVWEGGAPFGQRFAVIVCVCLKLLDIYLLGYYNGKQDGNQCVLPIINTYLTSAQMPDVCESTIGRRVTWSHN